MPSSETIELIRIKRIIGKLTDLPKPDPRSSIVSRIRTILLDIANIPVLRFLYGSSGKDSTITLAAPATLPRQLFSDGSNLYIGTRFVSAPFGVTGKIVKIDLSTFLEIQQLNFLSGESMILAMFSDGTSLYCYVNDLTFIGGEAAIIKVDILTFTRIAKLQLAAFPGITPRTMFSDGTYLYVGLQTGPGTIIKIDISTFAIVSTLVLNVGSNTPVSMFGDESFLYIGCGLGADTKVIAQIDLGTFTQVGTLVIGLPAIFAEITDMFVDSRYLYAAVTGTAPNPDVIIKVDLETFTSVATVGLGVLRFQNKLFADATFLYVPIGDYINPAQIARIDLSTFTITSYITLSAGQLEIGGLFSDETFLYASIPTTNQITREYLFPTNSAADRRITKMSTQVGTINTNAAIIPTIDTKVDTLTTNLSTVSSDVNTTVIYYILPTGTTGVTLLSGFGAYVQGTYVEVIAAGAIASDYYITSVFVTKSAILQNFEIQIATGILGAEVTIATFSHEVDNGSDSKEYIFSPNIKVVANTRISAICSDETGLNTINVKIRYRI